MKLDPGDRFNLDGENYEVISYYAQSDAYWVKQLSQHSMYYSASTMRQEDIDKWYKSGNLKILNKQFYDSQTCYHIWKRYTGIRDVFDYCDLCNMKKFIDWKDLK